MKFEGDVIIIDPCSVVTNNDDWHNCDFGCAMEKLGFTDFLYKESDSDGVLKVVDSDSGEIIGTVCTDSCVYVVLLFEELLRYNPGFSDHIRYPENCVILRDFSGDIVIDNENRIAGTGNRNFRTE